jgi:dGTPase
LIDDILRDIARDHPRLDPPRHAHELVRRVITRMIEDVIGESRRRLEALNPASVTDVRRAGKPLVGFSSNFAAADRAIKDFLYPRLYRHDRVMRIMTEAEAVVRRLFERFVHNSSDMPAEWLADLEPGDAIGRALRIADYIAGMTDRYAIGEHTRLFGSTPELR